MFIDSFLIRVPPNGEAVEIVLVQLLNCISHAKEWFEPLPHTMCKSGFNI